MKISLLILLLVSALTDILCQNFKSDEDNWMNDRYPDEVSDFTLALLLVIEEVISAQKCNIQLY